MIQTGFQLHKQAVNLAMQLNDVVRWTYGTKEQAIGVDAIYEQPVYYMRELLSKMKQRTLATNQAWYIQMITERYAPYEDYILAQLEPEIANCLHEDLKTLNKNLQSSVVSLVFQPQKGYNGNEKGSV